MHRQKSDLAAIPVTFLGILWLGVFPLLCDFTYSHITRTKWIIALIMGGLTLTTGLGVALCSLFPSARRLRPAIRWGDPLRLLCLAYFGWTVLSARFGTWSLHTQSDGSLTVWLGSGRYEGLATQLCYLAIFLGMSLYPVRLRPVALFSALGLLIFSVIVALQYAGFNPLSLFPVGRSIRTNYEFQGTIGNIDMVSGYLSLVVPLLLGGWLIWRGWPAVLMLLGGICGMLLFLLIEVQSGLMALVLLLGLVFCLMVLHPDHRARGMVILGSAFLCLSCRLILRLPWLDDTANLMLAVSPARLSPTAIGCLFFVAARILQKHPGRAISPAALIAFLLAAAIVLVSLLSFLPIPPSAGGLWELHELLHGHIEDSFGSWRIGVWRHTLRMASDQLLFGTGPDTFYPAMRSYLTSHAIVLGENFDNPHNLYLAILSNCGLPALLLYLSFLTLLLIRCLRRKDGIGTVLAWMVLCYSLQALFTFSICIVSPMLWATLGMACAAPRKDDPHESHPER